MEKNYSVALDLVRGASAQLVVFGHSISILGIFSILEPPRFPYIQNIGVVLFFFISGAVITHAITTQRPTFWRFMLDRSTRIYTALIPALILVAIVDRQFMWLPEYAYYADKVSLYAFIGNLLMMASYPIINLADTDIDLSLMRVAAFGTITPLWSVAAEFWLHVFFGFIALRSSLSGWLSKLASAILVAISLPVVLNTFTGNLGGGLAIVWLAGSAYYKFVIIGGALRGRMALNVSALVMLCIALAIRRNIPGSGYDLRFSLMVCVAVVFGIEVYREARMPEIITNAVERSARFLASYSYSLYLLHSSIILPLYLIYGRDATATEKVALLLGGIAISNIASWIFCWLFESRYRAIRKLVLTWWKLDQERTSIKGTQTLRLPPTNGRLGLCTL